MTDPAFDTLSLGAGVQSTTLALLAAEGRLPRPRAAIFSDTGWEPRAVYEHLNRLDAEVLQPAGIPLLRVSAQPGKGRPTGNLRTDSLSPGGFMRMPVFVRSRNRERRDAIMVRRQCTEEYKTKPVKKATRDLLGYPHPRPVPRGVFVRQWLGISRDEVHRAGAAHVLYLSNAFPLLGVGLDAQLVGADGAEGWTRNDCLRYLRSHGFGSTPKSSCIGCPFHGNRQWRELRDNHPDEWADAVAFDAELRSGQLQSIKDPAFLHRSLLPLAEAPIDRTTRGERAAAQVNIFDAIADAELEEEEGATVGCSPWGCRSEASARRL